MNMYPRDLLNYTAYYEDGRDLVVLCCVAIVTGHTAHVTFSPRAGSVGLMGEISFGLRAGCGSDKREVLPTPSAAPKPLGSQLLSYLGKHPLALSQPRQRKWLRTRATMALHPFRQSLSEQGHGRFVQAGWEG